jgi:DNA-binding transcriptional MerR regulator
MSLDWPEELPESKLYYSIGELADALDVQQSTLRYWEDEFDRLDPDHSPGGQRRYRQEDVRTVLRIRHLLRDEQFKIEGARGKLRNWSSYRSPQQTAERIRTLCDESLQDINEFIESL